MKKIYLSSEKVEEAEELAYITGWAYRVLGKACQSGDRYAIEAAATVVVETLGRLPNIKQ